MTLDSETSSLLTGCGETTKFTMLVNWIDNPIDTWVVTNGVMSRINANDLKVFVCTVLSYPIRVQNTETSIDINLN
jgi:hypothetical protein